MGVLEKLKQEARARGHSPRTASSYCVWVRLFYKWSGEKPAAEWSGTMVGDFLRWMAQPRQKYSEISRHQALCAMVYCFKWVLRREMGDIGLPAPKRHKAVQKPCLTRAEVFAILNELRGPIRLQAELLYGGMLRIMEMCRLRVKDLDFGNGQILVNDGKGAKARLATLPVSLVDPLLSHLAFRKAQHRCELESGGGRAPLPGRLAEKYPSYVTQFRWQFVFPSAVERDGVRWHATPRALQEAFSIACNRIGLLKRAVPHSLRHAGATHLHDAGVGIRTIQDLLGHSHLETTEIYTHNSRLPNDVPSPLDLPIAGFVLPTADRRPLQIEGAAPFALPPR